MRARAPLTRGANNGTNGGEAVWGEAAADLLDHR